MRTNTLLLAAAIGVAGASSAFAQVYSVNAVGYVTLDLAKGFSIIANPLDAGSGNNTLDKVLAAVPEGTMVYKYDGATYKIATFDTGAWEPLGVAVAPGEGFFIRLPEAAKVTFVGEVMQGSLKNPVPAGFSLRSSQVPQAGKLTTDLQFPAADGDMVYTYDGTKYSIFTFDAGWDPEPVVAVGQGFWSRKIGASSWDRTFSVNQ